MVVDAKPTTADRLIKSSPYELYAPASARKSVSQFLKSHDPAISMLRRFAKAAGVPLGQLLGE